MPEQDVRDQPFMDGFKVLADHLEDGYDRLERLEKKPMDVDRWELVLSPQEYLKRFESSLADVQLISRAPVRKLHTTYHRGPAFDRYLLLAQATHQLWVALDCKDAFFTELNRYQVAQPGILARQASLGNVHIPTAVFIHCLISAGCDTIRLKAYGQKMPMVDRFLHAEPAQTDHKWAEHNEWDIGNSFDSPYIWLFSSATGRHHNIRHYPMMVPGSLDYGTVNIKASHQLRHFSVKIYPRIVHVIKSFNSRLQGGVPKTLNGVRYQLGSALRMIHSLTGKDDRSLGGFRIEVTVKAASLKEATRLVHATGFLEPSYWLGIGEGPHYRHTLNAKLVKREAFLQNANWVYQQAEINQVFRGRDHDHPSKQQLQALTDVLNALGWNAGFRKPTKSLSPTAWWSATQDMAPTCFGTLSDLYQTDDEIGVLFDMARTCVPNGLPCQRNPDVQGHRYQRNGTAPFRLRCAKAGCYHKLTRAAVIHWIAHLVTVGLIDLINLTPASFPQV